MGARRFPPPGTVEETDACFIVPTPLGRRWTYVYFEEESGRGVAAKQLTRDEAPGTAANSRQAAGTAAPVLIIPLAAPGRCAVGRRSSNNERGRALCMYEICRSARWMRLGWGGRQALCAHRAEHACRRKFGTQATIRRPQPLHRAVMLIFAARSRCSATRQLSQIGTVSPLRRGRSAAP